MDILIEHQSEQDRFMPSRALEYVVMIYKRQLREWEKERGSLACQQCPTRRFCSHSPTTANNPFTGNTTVTRATSLFTQPNNREQPIHWQYNGDEGNKTASLTVKRDTGEFTFKGTGLKVDGLPIAEAVENYAVFVEQNWLTNRAIVRKEATGFSVEFDRRRQRTPSSTGFW